MSEAMEEEKTDRGRREKKILKIIISLFCAGGSLLYIYTAFFGQFTPFMQMTPLIVIALVIGFINYPKKKSRKSWVRFVDYFLALLSVGISIYLLMNEKQSTMALAPPTGIKFIAALIFIVLILEATRRVMGLPLVCIVLAFLIYAKYGNYLPGMLNHWGLEVMGGLLMIYPGWKTDLAGAIIGGIAILLQFSTRRKMKRELA